MQTMSTRRTRSKTGRKFGKDITNIVNDIDKVSYKQQILNNPQYQKPNLSSINTISLHPYPSYIQHSQQDNEKMIDQNTTMGSYWHKNAYPITRDPVYDYTEQIRLYVWQQSDLSVVQEDYMKWQVEIDIQKREILVSWIISIHHSFNLKPQTLFLAIHLLDQYGYKKCIMRNRYQLLGITCLFMAAKYEQLRTPRMSKYLKQCQGMFTKQQLLCQQAQILEIINFQMNQIIIAKSLLDLSLQEIFEQIQRDSIICEQITQDEKQLAGKLCLYILELSLIDYNFRLIKLKYLVPVIIYIALKIKNIHGARSKKILELYKLDQYQFRECFHMVNKMYKNRRQYKFMQINRKYGIYQNNKSTISNCSTYTTNNKSTIYHQ